MVKFVEEDSGFLFEIFFVENIDFIKILTSEKRNAGENFEIDSLKCSEKDDFWRKIMNRVDEIEIFDSRSKPKNSKSKYKNEIEIKIFEIEILVSDRESQFSRSKIFQKLTLVPFMFF